jgi:hypothetical protein
MTNRWTIEEESKLLKLIASGKTCRELSGGNYNFNRSENALELRLKKIIYENINNNKSPDKISQLLNIPRDKIMQSYYSYKDYIEKQKQSGGVSDNDNKNVSISNNMSNKINNLQNNFNKQHDIKQNGGDNMNLDRIERQNKKMKLLLENYILKQKLSKLLKNNHSNLQKEALDALIKN